MKHVSCVPANKSTLSPSALNCRTQSRDFTSPFINPHHVIGVFFWWQLIHQFKCVEIQQLKFSAGFQFVFRGEIPLGAVRSRLRSTDVMSHRSLLTDAMHPASKFSFPALDPCSDTHQKLDAPPGLISGSPTFLFFKPTSGSGTISS